MQQESLSVDLDTRYQHVLTDLLSIKNILQVFFQDIPSHLWHQKDRRSRPHDWTLHQTLAHLVAAAEYYHLTLKHALHQDVIIPSGLKQRHDLSTYNQQEITKRQHLQASVLVTDLQNALSSTIDTAQQLTSEQLTQQVNIPIFNRPITIIELLETQLVHPGLVHAAQIANPLGRDPLWRRYDAALIHRMLTRFFNLMAMIYWPERGGTTHATIQFLVAGANSGQWYVSVDPAGSLANEGRAHKPQLTLKIANTDILCQFFTAQLSATQALLRGKITLRGNLYLATRLMYLFSPT
jgi:hypothetical protein